MLGRGHTGAITAAASSSCTIGETAANTSTNLADYTTTISCVDTSSNNAVVASGSTKSVAFTPAAGHAYVCTTNTNDVGYIQITKSTVGGDGTFTFDVNDPNNDTGTITTSNGSGTTTLKFAMPAGSYNVSEMAATKSQLSDWVTTYNCGTTGSGTVAGVTVQAGQTVSCSFTNTHKSYITITKQAYGGDDTFGFSVTGRQSGPAVNPAH